MIELGEGMYTPPLAHIHLKKRGGCVMPIDSAHGAVGSVHVSHMTELDAVNMALTNAGEGPVSTLEDTLNVNALQSRKMLMDSSRDVQIEGWHFNTEYGVKLEVARPAPNIVPVPKNALRCDVSPHGKGARQYLERDIVMRGDRLYDLKAHTDRFDEDVYCTITYLLPFEALPETARWYIAVKAARRFRQSVTGGDDGMGSITAQDESRARNTLMREDVQGIDMGFLTPQHNTWLGHDMARVFRRRL